MTDTSPAALRALADEIKGAIIAGKDFPSMRPRWERHSAVLMMRTEGTLRALADQMEAKQANGNQGHPTMTHLTIEKAVKAAQDAAGEVRVGVTAAQYFTHVVQAAARVILAAEPSDVEIEAMIDAWNTWRGCPLEDRAKEALKARDAAKAKEMGL